MAYLGLKGVPISLLWNPCMYDNDTWGASVDLPSSSGVPRVIQGQIILGYILSSLAYEVMQDFYHQQYPPEYGF